MAEAGTRLLAREIVSFWSKRGKGRPLSVCVPGGTCSTAVLLHRAIRELQSEAENDAVLDIEVVVIPCIGDDAYARRQMMALNAQTGKQAEDIPTIMAPSANDSYFGQSTQKQNGYFAFGEPDLSILSTFQEMGDEHQLVLDLLYGAPSWTIMLRHWRTKQDPEFPFEKNAPIAGREIMYVHSGGLEGISSQLLRYKHKGLIDLDEIQLPGRNKGSKGETLVRSQASDLEQDSKSKD
jgi:1-aminocyclopropane-1-carboxylate deaminase/D-cysteine desulfhydrase-like pyridoxal-dependent ACC family enzyme